MQELAWKPLPTQQWALDCPSFELLFGGSKGGGKTQFLVAAPLRMLSLADQKWRTTGQQQRTVRNMVFRKNLEDLRDMIAKTWALYPLLDPGAAFHEKEKYWRFSSGATVEMNHLDDPRSHERFNGQEFATLLVDEVQFIPYEAYSYLLAQVRSKDPDYRKLLMVRCTANPGGPHGDWVRRHFHIDECPDGGRIFSHKVKLFDGSEREVTRTFIRSYLRDNPYIAGDGTYEANLRASMSPDEVRMYLDGDFDCVAGAFFSHLLRSIHFVKSYPIPGSLDMMHSTDWGSSAPACTLWGARDYDNRILVIDELHRPGITGRTYGEAMREKYKFQKWSHERTWLPEDFWGVIDTQAMDRYGSEATAAAGIMERGFRIFPADKLPGERPVGINQIKERLLMDRFGKPQMVIFEDRCPQLVRALKGIQSCAPIDPEDYDPKSPLAHAVDALRFLCMKWPIQPEDKTNPMDAEVARWNRILRAQKRPDENDGRMTGGYG